MNNNKVCDCIHAYVCKLNLVNVCQYRTTSTRLESQEKEIESLKAERPFLTIGGVNFFMNDKCVWEQDDKDQEYAYTQCGNEMCFRFYIKEKNNDFKYCPFCGKEIEVKA